MSGKRVLSWLQQGWNAFVDPDREERLERLVSQVRKQLAADREKFNYKATASRLEIENDDRCEIAERIYRHFLSKAWSDDSLSDKEQRSLEMISQRLLIPATKAKEFLLAEGVRAFSTQLGKAFTDGILDEAEYAKLALIASSCGTTPAEFFRNQFRDEGEAFIRNLFVKVWEDGRLDDSEWAMVLQSVRRLGLTDQQFKEAVEAPAHQLVEHFLADAKSDGEISNDEEKLLDWMLGHLVNDKLFKSYVQIEVEETKRFANIRRGTLPSIGAPRGVAIKSGEIVHFTSSCTFKFLRRRGDNTLQEKVTGVSVITDDRFLFVSGQQSLQVIHSKILGYKLLTHGLEIQCAGRAAGQYLFGSDSSVGAEIWIAAIGRANQTLVSSIHGKPSRHVPRDVRQRVWQKFGGRCAECSATQYLEYDHIIPVARGGGNTENNVQLLCRGCNSKKSDFI